MGEFSLSIKKDLTEKILHLEEVVGHDVIFFYGPIGGWIVGPFRDFIESLQPKKEGLSIVLDTTGGSVEAVERLVNITRSHYKRVDFIVPNMAMSAGTVWVMSGDTIFMEYSSILGPIDPQVWNGSKFVPALGYLEQFDKFIEKDRENKLTNAEFALLKNMDLAELNNAYKLKN